MRLPDTHHSNLPSGVREGKPALADSTRLRCGTKKISKADRCSNPVRGSQRSVHRVRTGHRTPSGTPTLPTDQATAGTAWAIACQILRPSMAASSVHCTDPDQIFSCVVGSRMVQAKAPPSGSSITPISPPFRVILAVDPA